ncbi:hypothetical protein C4K68_22680 [Pokkaliibacter plantistimulans]|uniref:Uncharacterized protein n=2 Tax=Pseudomonadota TaxID=1224 RepID=A0A2S5KJM8_9PROT|nr:hypothetical protein C4K68_22680 [Pokkaliibacter plantistimulans]
MEPELGKPIDIDFLLFTYDEINKIKSIAFDISSYVNRVFPLIPHLDIKVINCRFKSPELLFNALLVKKTGRLLYGDELPYNAVTFMENHNEIISFTILEAESKLYSVIQTSDKKIQNKRVPHLSKSILRIAGLLRLKEGIYTRSPQDCTNILYKKYPNLIKHVAIIFNGFRYPFLTDELLASYFIVLNEIKQDMELE